MNDKYKVKETKKIFSGHIFKIFVDLVEMPSGRVVEREMLAHGGAVGIVPITSKREVLLVEQYRHAVRDRILEIPAGKLNADEDPLECAVRELKEETGATVSRIEKLSEFFNAPGYSSEIFYLYLAHIDSIGDPEPDGDEEEDMNVIRILLDEALDMVKNGKINDAKTIIGLLLASQEID